MSVTQMLLMRSRVTMQGLGEALWRKPANEAYEAGEEEFGAGTQAPDARLRHLKPHLPILMHLSVCKARLAENSR